MQETFTPLQLFWVSPHQELYDVLSPVPLPPEAWTQGRWLALYQVNNDKGYYQLNDVTFIKQNQPNDITIPDGSLGTKIDYGFSNNGKPFRKATIIDILRTDGFNCYHANIDSGIINEESYVDTDRDLFVEVIANYDPTHTLAFVNGIYHESVVEPKTNKLFIRDGYATLQKARISATVTLVDFGPLGGIKKLPFEEKWILDKSTVQKGLILQIKDHDLTQYTPVLVNDGRFYLPGEHLSVLNSNSLLIQTGGIKFYTDFYRSPALKRTEGMTLDDGILPKSDARDKDLGMWVGKTSVPKDIMAKDNFIIDRLKSNHSGIILLPKGIKFYTYPIQQFNKGEHSYVYPEFDTPLNSVLVSNGLISAPVFMRAKSITHRAFLFDPRSSDFYDDPADDPLRDVDYSPDRALNTLEYRQRLPKLFSIVKFHSEKEV